MKQLKAKISGNKQVAEGFYRMRLKSPYLAKNTKPGQFLEIRCSKANEPLLRRPLSAHRILDDGVELLYEVVGPGTERLSGKAAGEYLDVVGPLGNGFNIPSDKRPAILVGGGVGVASLFALAEKISAKKAGSYAIIGAKKAQGVLCEKELKRMGCFVMVSTEDGSRGRKGYATDILRHLLKVINCQTSGIYACGPHPMLKAAAHIADLSDIPCQVSLDERMACGIGVCLGCPVKVKTKGVYKMVCKEGPVFNAEEIVW